MYGSTIQDMPDMPSTLGAREVPQPRQAVLQDKIEEALKASNDIGSFLQDALSPKLSPILMPRELRDEPKNVEDLAAKLQSERLMERMDVLLFVLRKIRQELSDIQSRIQL